MPFVEDMLNAAGQSSWFCLLDLKSAYWQIPMENSSICKTVFSTQQGHYEFVRMPFELAFAGCTFQSRADEALYPVRDVCRAYLDDLLSHADSFEASCEGLRRVLQVLIDAKLLASFSKCKFLMREVPYLGFLLTADGIRIDPMKTEAIANLKVPNDVPELQHVLGLFQHYARFHPQFASTAVSLTNLTQKHTPWYWTPTCQRAFEDIKRVLTLEPVLTRPDFSLPSLSKQTGHPQL